VGEPAADGCDRCAGLRHAPAAAVVQSDPPLRENSNLALLIAFYLCVPIALFALYNLEQLLRSISAGEVFLRSNVSLIRRVCICCLLVSAVCLPAALYYPPLIFFCIVMAFLCPVVNVVRRVFDAAVTIREENDLTI
jgi:hypothetical protein